MLSELEAKRKAIKATKYCYVLTRADLGTSDDFIRLERIFVKGCGEEIRLAWWKNGRQGLRPADINADQWVTLFSKALEVGVFSPQEMQGMQSALSGRQ